VVVFLVFLLFAVQLLFSLYASSTITAVANDAARRAASAAAPPLAQIEADARRQLGTVGEAATFSWDHHDTDDDGEPDTVVLQVVAHPPRFIPPSIGGAIGLGDVHRTVRARLEGIVP
jgi:hypothetical protein